MSKPIRFPLWLRLGVTVLSLVAWTPTAAHAQCADAVLASTSNIGCQCSGQCPQLPYDCINVDITPDGRFVVFAARDPGGNYQIYRHDRDGDENGVFDARVGRPTTQLTSSLTGSSWQPRISDDGGSIVFTSTATDLIDGCPDLNGNVADIYRIDLTPVVCGLTLGNNSRVSVDENGCQGLEDSFSPSISADGARVAFLTASVLDGADDTNTLVDLYVRTYLSVPCAQTTLQCSPPPAPPVCGVCDSFISVESRGLAIPPTLLDAVSQNASVSSGEITADGKYVVFASPADDLDIAGMDTNGDEDVFLRELLPAGGGRTQRMTTNAQPGMRPTTSSLTGSLINNTLAGELAYEEVTSGGAIRVRDLATSMEVVTGVQASLPRIADNGRQVAFERGGSVWMFDAVLGTEGRIDCGNGATLDFGLARATPAITANGKELAFASSSTDLVASDTNDRQDAFVVRSDGALGSSFCDGVDGSLSQCPCGNAGDLLAGCDNPASTGGVELRLVQQMQLPTPRATLAGTGFPSATRPTALVLRSTALRPAGPVVFRDGIQCLASPLDLLNASFAQGGTSRHELTHTSGTGLFYYQLWYRSQPATFCDPTAASNLSSGRRIAW